MTYAHTGKNNRCEAQGLNSFCHSSALFVGNVKGITLKEKSLVESNFHSFN